MTAAPPSCGRSCKLKSAGGPHSGIGDATTLTSISNGNDSSGSIGGAWRRELGIPVAVVMFFPVHTKHAQYDEI